MLSIVITTLNDTPELLKTVASIRATAGDLPEIIVVDDASYMPVQCPSAKVIRNPIRIGVGPSRHLGVMNASREFVLLTDSHMRFEPGWHETALHRLAARPKTVHCAVCLALRHETMSLAHPMSEYHGATLNVCGPDRHRPDRQQVFEAVWNSQHPADDAEICCVMGAGYFVPRDWFLKLAPLHHLRQWGQDETMLSVKSWLAGGDCRMLANVRIGHRFAEAKDKKFSLTSGYPTANRLFALHTLLPPPLAAKLEIQLQRLEPAKEWADAQALFRHDTHLVRVEQERNCQLFTRDFLWLADKFKLPLPL